eukprot:6745729-Alexandrium_andersonii.AAC.1
MCCDAACAFVHWVRALESGFRRFLRLGPGLTGHGRMLSRLNSMPYQNWVLRGVWCAEQPLR